MTFNGVNMGLGNIMKLSDAQSRSASAENVYGEKGKGAMAQVDPTPQPEVQKIGQVWQVLKAPQDLGVGWKVRPYIVIPAGQTATILDVDGPGAIQHVWITIDSRFHRDLILRMHWDGEETPSVECPLGDFFCCSWKARPVIAALPINVNPSGGLNCFFPMPFRRHARVTIENRGPDQTGGLYYSVNYALTSVGDDDAYFHAQFRRANPLPQAREYAILDGVRGKGQYVGTFMAWQQNSAGWWGEGEFKAFLDGDGQFPTICGTGTEDYFGGAWCFGANYSAPFMGYPWGDSTSPQHSAGTGRPGNRHLLYRFHVMDPIRFQSDLRVTMQALGWRAEHRYLPLQDDIASVAYWYQREPHAPFPALGTRDDLEII